MLARKRGTFILYPLRLSGQNRQREMTAGNDKMGSIKNFLPCSLLMGICFSPLRSPAQDQVTIDFNRDVRPILSENCFHCHGPDAGKRKADLRLDTPGGILADLGGHSAVVPGSAARSELATRIRHRDPDELMPPPQSKRVLKAREIEILTRWIDQGATWAKHWSFIPPARSKDVGSQTPEVSNPIDKFILARLEAEGLSLSPGANRRTLIRRLSLDLTGMPPTPSEVDAFLADKSLQAYEKVVDRLLASSRYGERMAWDWLDAARYADTSGYQGDPERTMWPWRDWVIRALNSNMPFDQFTIEQIAGDLLPNPTLEQKVATGFHRNHMHNGEGGRIAEETRVENVMDRVETTATLWLGLTMTCSRCHDHKYDPITMRDYYALYDFFNQTSESGKGRGGKVAPIVDKSTPEEKARVAEAGKKVTAMVKKVEAFELVKFPRPDGAPLTESDAVKLPGNLPSYIARTPPGKRGVNQLLEAVGYFKKRDPEYTQVLQKHLDAVRARTSASNNITRVMVMDTIKKPRDTFILVKGSYRNLTDTAVTSAFPTVLAPAPKPDTHLTRLDLARWLVSVENPLTARVTVNRHWQFFFGRGLVKTSEDFGTQGSPPSRPALLDWLANEFMEKGWNIKALHRLILTSKTYRQQSHLTPGLLELDPDNILLARSPRYRLPSWMLHDQALAASGLYVEKVGGPSVKPYQPQGIWAEATFGKKKYVQDHGDALYRRSLYIYWRRIVGPTMFFDTANRQVCSVKTSLTNTPLHALTLLNETTYVEAARAMAERILHEVEKKPASRINRAYHLVLGRPATSEEKKLLTARLTELQREYAADPAAAQALLKVGESKRDETLDPIEHASYAVLCSLILNLDETLAKQ